MKWRTGSSAGRRRVLHTHQCDHGIGSTYWRYCAVPITFNSMSSNITTDNSTCDGRDPRSGRFLTGNTCGPGRKVGSRNLLTTQFLDDLRATWATHGRSALE